METAAGVRYFRRSRGGIETAPEAPVLVRYADDRAPRTLTEVAM
jgi:RNA-directed DNA polymerase